MLRQLCDMAEKDFLEKLFWNSIHLALSGNERSGKHHLEMSVV